MNASLLELFGPVISSYTRQQAIEDGVLVNLTQLYPEESKMYRYPVACTAAVWNLVEQAVAQPRNGNSYAGVVWDILYMSVRGIIRRRDDQTALFQVTITGTGRNRLHTMKAMCGPGDDAEPVITIMLSNED